MSSAKLRADDFPGPDSSKVILEEIVGFRFVCKNHTLSLADLVCKDIHINIWVSKFVASTMRCYHYNIHQEEYIEILEYIFERYSIDPHIDQNFIFYVACVYYCDKIVRYLLKTFNYDLDLLLKQIQICMDAPKNIYKHIPVRVLMIFLEYSMNIQYCIDEKLFEWLSLKPENLEKIIAYGCTIPPYVLMEYIQWGRHKLAKILLDANLPDITVNIYSDDPFKTAALNGDIKMIILLNNYGKPITYIDFKPKLNTGDKFVNVLTDMGMNHEQIMDMLLYKIQLMEDRDEGLSHHSDWNPIETSEMLLDVKKNKS